MQELTKPQVEFTPSVIKYDFTSVDNSIDVVEKTIDKLELVEENIDEIKRYNTSLNKLATALNDDKKNIKTNVAPDLKEFEDECMKRVNRLKAIREKTKNFVDDVEIIRKENKKAEIKEFFNNLDNTCDVPFEICMRDEYLLKTCSGKKWKEDINLNKELFEKEYNRLNDVNVDDVELLKKLFLDNWDYGKTRDEYDRIKALTAENPVDEETETLINDVPSVDITPIETVNVMVCISGNKTDYEKTIKYARDLGLVVEVI